MIITVTPNPSIDRALDLNRIELGQVNRADSAHLDAGGKGINVSRVLQSAGVNSEAIVPVGGPDGRLMVDLLTELGLVVHPVAISGETRSNITLQEAHGATTKINAPGPTLDTAEQEAVFDAVRKSARSGDTVVGAGSLPRGADPDFYVKLAKITRKAEAELVVDASGPPLREVVKRGSPTLIKPNEEELGELVGRELTTVGEVVDAAREVIAMGTTQVLVSLGAHGALLVDADHSVWAGGPALIPASTVGAGDSTLAGYLAVQGTTHERLRHAVAWGRAAVMLPGTAAPARDQIDLESVSVRTDVPMTTPLKEL